MKNIRESKEYMEFGYRVVRCPICNNETLDNHYICPNCNWEYDNITEGYSCANNCTVEEYKKKVDTGDWSNGSPSLSKSE